MNVHASDVNPPVEPTLFPGGALSLTIEALLDPEDCTVLFIVRGWDVGAGKLIALWSSSPKSFDDYELDRRRAWKEFYDLLTEHTGPF